MENTNTYESWIRSENNFSGYVMQIQNNDTIILELLKIKMHNNSIYYEATVKNENKGKPVLFKLVNQNKNRFHFQNPKHDFPQNIIYDFSNDSVVNITISDSTKYRNFLYKKIK